MSSLVPVIVWLMVDCCATAADGKAAAPSSNTQSKEFFIFSFPKPIVDARTLACAPWLLAERLGRG
jgi:hypothetical protein